MFSVSTSPAPGWAAFVSANDDSKGGSVPPTPRDAIVISPEASEGGAAALELVDAQITDAQAELHRLRLSVENAILSGDPMTLDGLAAQTGLLQARLGSLLAKVLDDTRWEKIEDMVDLARLLRSMINGADDGIASPAPTDLS